jgi:hypothetical protein
MGKRNQAQPAMRSRMTAEPLCGVVVAVTDPHREVQCSNVMIEAGTPQLGVSPHPASLIDRKRRQERV